VLVSGQLVEFVTRGVVPLPAFVPRPDVDGVADRVWEILGRRGIVRDAPATWPVGRPGKLQSIHRAGVYAPFEGERLDGIVDDVLGAGRWVRFGGPAPLISFPEPGPWELPHKSWHFDLPARGGGDRPVALRLLGIVEAVRPQGGGTLVVEGSHELVRRQVRDHDGDAGHSADVRKTLARRFAWFRELFTGGGDRRRFFAPATVDGVTVRVTEITGDAGDACLMHPWTLHGLAPNTGGTIRSMATHTVYADDFRFA
jgi:hypothetical protein